MNIPSRAVPRPRWVTDSVTAVPSPSGASTAVTLTVTQRGRGTARLGMWMMRRATRQRLDDALDGLEGSL